MSSITELTSDANLFDPEALPNVKFKKNIAALSNVFYGINDCVDLRSMFDEITPDNVVYQVTNRYNQLKACPEHRVYFAQLDQFANNIGVNILNTFNILSNSIKPEVDALVERINKLANAHLESREVVQPDMKVRAYDMDFDWDGLFEEFGGASQILVAFEEYFNMKPAGTMTDVRVIAGGRDFDKETIDVPTDVIKQAFVKNDLGEKPEFIDDFCEMVRTSWGVRQLTGRVMNALLRRNHIGDTLQAIKETARYKKMIDTVLSFNYDVIDSVAERIEESAKILLKALYFVMYIAVILRKNAQDDKVIVIGPYVNPDVLPEFEEQGGTRELLSKYVRINYLASDRPIPARGIRMDDVIADKARVEERFEADAAALNLRMATERHTATVRAIEEVLTDYLLNVDEVRRPEGLTADQFEKMHRADVRKACLNLTTTGDNNLENSLYDFVIGLWYANTPVAAAHKLFGEEVVAQLSINPELDSNTATIIDASVAAAIAAQFLVDNVLE